MNLLIPEQETHGFYPDVRLLVLADFASSYASSPEPYFVQHLESFKHPYFYYFAAIRIAPSKRMTSPFKYEFSAICPTKRANSSGFPKRDGYGTICPKAS